MAKVILFNPRSAKWKHRIPNSILQVGASIHGKHEYIFAEILKLIPGVKSRVI
jgi:anaerobic magnesium-protoporphyrin IX monomethyl ester cyclase